MASITVLSNSACQLTSAVSVLLTLPSKTNLQDHARLCKNLARILHARRALHNLAPILARSCKKCARNAGNYSCSNSCKILHHFLQANVQDCARIMQEKGHIACTCQASLACKILARFLHDLQVRFCWVWLCTLALKLGTVWLVHLTTLYQLVALQERG